MFSRLVKAKSECYIKKNTEYEVDSMNKFYYSSYYFTGFAFSERSRSLRAVDFH